MFSLTKYQLTFQNMDHLEVEALHHELVCYINYRKEKAPCFILKLKNKMKTMIISTLKRIFCEKHNDILDLPRQSIKSQIILKQSSNMREIYNFQTLNRLNQLNSSITSVDFYPQSQLSSLSQANHQLDIIKTEMKLTWLIVAVILALCRSDSCPDCYYTHICGSYHWTKWINRDRPGGVGDYETVADAVHYGGCKYPIWIECQTTTGIPWWKTGEVIQFSTSYGCVCNHASQPDKKCNYDYQIRELCP